MEQKLNICLIYTSEDKGVLLQVMSHLGTLKKDFNISIWQDCSVNSMEEWILQTKSYLEKTDIYLLLISNTFMHSEFVQRIEFKNVIDSYKENRATVIPILIDNCPWNVDFNSDDYDFNMKELQVLPEGQKPIHDWDSPDSAYLNIDSNLKKVFVSMMGESSEEESNLVVEKIVQDAKTEDQITLDFNQEIERNKKIEAEVKAKREAEETRKKLEEAKLKGVAEAEKRRIEKVALEQKRKEEIRFKEESETKKRAEEKKKNEEVEAKRRLAELNALKEEQKQDKVSSIENDSEKPPEGHTNSKRRILLGLLLSFITIIGIWMFSEFTGASKEDTETPVQAEVPEIIDSVILEKTNSDSPPIEKESLSKLEIGDYHDGGIVFSVSDSGTTGIIAHLDDAGPMSWENAIKINEELGEDWRLPTFDELKMMYETIGNGATNSGEFANKLYWSATDYDEYQARLIRFSNGNTSYHYNKMAAHRQFLVRAVQDFNR